MKIAIDIGHADGTGASGNGYEEHSLCCVIATHLAQLLRQAEHEVQLIDFADESNSADLRLSAQAVNKSSAQLLISLHADCASNSRARGAHVCYISSKGKQLAMAIARPLCELMPGRAQHVQRRDNLYILRATTPVAVLVECGFISNARDAAMMSASPELVAAAIADGLCRFSNC